jgi:hypothetical protein
MEGEGLFAVDEQRVGQRFNLHSMHMHIVFSR